jgi:hypothetical protein
MEVSKSYQPINPKIQHSINPNLFHPLQQMISHPQRIGYNRQRRIHCAARREEAGIDDVEIVHFVRFAVAIKRGSLRIVAETNRAVLMRDAGQRDALSEKTPQGNDVRWPWFSPLKLVLPLVVQPWQSLHAECDQITLFTASQRRYIYI